MQRDLSIHGERHSGRDDRRGQVLVIFALFLVVLVLFMGLGIDLGFAYITKAQLSKAVDAAALAGMSNFYQGAGTASNIAAGTFSANFSHTNGYVRALTGPSIAFSTDSASNETLTVSATATINTFFIRVLPQWTTLTVADTGKATRAKVIMTLVLDHSGSMDPNCTGSDCSQGGSYLPAAVVSFINVFEDNVDSAAVVTFGSSVTNALPMSTPFIAKVTTLAGSITWAGGTFAHGGLTNALQINNAVVVPTNVNAVKVVVFFTDGEPNMIQTVTSCPGGTAQRYNFGGYASDPAGIWNTNALSNSGSQNTPNCRLPCGTCTSSTTFPSVSGGTLPYTMDGISQEATNRCIQVAGQMRAAGMYVYCIGLDAGGVDPQHADFLRQVANDPDSATFNRNLPVGQALVTDNGANLSELFQQIAGDILLRLTY